MTAAFQCRLQQRGKWTKRGIVVRGKCDPASPLWELTRHERSHSVTCHPANVSFPPPKRIQFNSVQVKRWVNNIVTMTETLPERVYQFANYCMKWYRSVRHKNSLYKRYTISVHRRYLFHLQAGCRREDVSVVDNAAHAGRNSDFVCAVDRLDRHNTLPRPGVFACFSAVDDACQRHVRFDRWIATGLVCYTSNTIQEAQLSPRDRAMRRVSWNLANCHATVQKLLVRKVLNQVSAVANWPVRQNRAVDSAWRSVR